MVLPSDLKKLIKESVNQEIKEIFGLFGKRKSTEKLPPEDIDPASASPNKPQVFSLLNLKKLKTSKEIREYARKTLEHIGLGQARDAYAIDENSVLKVVRSDSKAYQNKNEVENSKCLGSAYSVQVSSYHPRYIWIVEERVKRLATSAEMTAKFNQLSGLEEPELMFVSSMDIQDFMTDIPSLLTRTSESNRYQHRHDLLMRTSPWYKGLAEKLTGCQVASWDFHKNNWGIRPSTGELVLLDVGFSRHEQSAEVKFFKEIIDKALEEEFNDAEPAFSIQELKIKNSLDEVTKYLRSSLGESDFNGAFRAVWIVDKQQIVKVVLSPNHIHQNKNEVKNAECLGTTYAPKIIDYDKKNYYWIIEENLEQLPGKEIYQKLYELLNYQFTNWMALRDFFSYSVNKGVKKVPSPKDDTPKDIFSMLYRPEGFNQNLFEDLYGANEWFTGLIDGLKGCTVISHDFHPGNWGVRPSTGELVILDLGF